MFFGVQGLGGGLRKHQETLVHFGFRVLGFGVWGLGF